MREQLAEFLPNVYRFARQLTQDTHLAEDLTQEAMVKAFAAWEHAWPEKPLSWLFRVVENLWRDRCRQKQHRPRHESLDAQGSLAAAHKQPFAKLMQAEEVHRVLEEVQRLPERQRAVLHLLACEQLTIHEISEILEITPEAVRSSLSLARKQMRQLMEDTSSQTMSTRKSES